MAFYFVLPSDTNRLNSHDLRNVYTRLEQGSAAVPLHTCTLEFNLDFRNLVREVPVYYL